MSSYDVLVYQSLVFLLLVVLLKPDLEKIQWQDFKMQIDFWKFRITWWIRRKPPTGRRKKPE